MFKYGFKSSSAMFWKNILEVVLKYIPSTLIYYYTLSLLENYSHDYSDLLHVFVSGIIYLLILMCINYSFYRDNFLIKENKCNG